MERCPPPDSAELEWGNARLAQLRRQGFSDRTLERLARVRWVTRYGAACRFPQTSEDFAA